MGETEGVTVGSDEVGELVGAKVESVVLKLLER